MSHIKADIKTEDRGEFITLLITFPNGADNAVNVRDALREVR